MQARRIARELALLGMSQLPDRPEKLQQQDLDTLLQAAVQTLTLEARDTLESAAAELQRSDERLVASDIQATDVQGARTMVQDAIALTQTAINRLGMALELPEFIQLTNRKAVRNFALELLTNVAQQIDTIDEQLDQVMIAWQVKRLARIDRDILRLAIVDIQYLGTPDRVAINEAVELSKRYSGDEGHRFINGVLRRVVNANARSSRMAAADTSPSA
ncbi:transcription antitermination factor NusB [Halomicronema hongdechloris]